MAKPKAAIVMGSESDWGVMERCAQQLARLGIEAHIEIMSAHRSPERVQAFAESARDEGFNVIIAAAGMSAALAGTIAAHTTLPVIGVPLAGGALQGIDALLSTVQMPSGVPVATVAIGEAGATNAGVLAAQIIAAKDNDVARALDEHKAYLARNVAAKNRALHERLRSGKGGQPATSEQAPPSSVPPQAEPGRPEATPAAREEAKPRRLRGGMSVSVGHETPEPEASGPAEDADLQRLAELAGNMSEEEIKALQELARRFQEGKEE